MEIIVDNRLFIIGLTELFRSEMKVYEAGTLLPIAQAVCQALAVEPAQVPVEGYYYESEELTHFFKLVRALQRTPMPSAVPKPVLDGIHALRKALHSPAMGRVAESSNVLHLNSSPFTQALETTDQWVMQAIADASQKFVRDDDAGLVAVACASGDPVAICATRETMALTEMVCMASPEEPEVPHFIWQVTAAVEDVAKRFVSALQEATAIMLPPPAPEAAETYAMAARDAYLDGRCILVGQQPPSIGPLYHWYIDAWAGAPKVIDFWSNSMWTTEKLRDLPVEKRPTAGATLEMPEPQFIAIPKTWLTCFLDNFRK